MNDHTTCGHAHAHPANGPCGCGHRHACPPDPDALISARGITVTRNGRDLLSGVDLDVRRSEIVTVIGPNGAGKTTLVKVIVGIVKPDRGTIVSPKSTRVGYVPQKFAVDRTIPMTVRHFLGLGNDAGERDVAAALAETGVERTAQQQIWELSGGEVQRVLIARALLRKPNLLVLDEPASGVDYTGEADLYDLIGRLRDSRGLGILLVSHDLHFVMGKSDRVLCLNVHVCCSGRPDAVAQHDQITRLFGPEAARSLGIYHHHHDHRHDISGQPLPEGGQGAGERGQ